MLGLIRRVIRALKGEVGSSGVASRPDVAIDSIRGTMWIERSIGRILAGLVLIHEAK